jgi:hypothetical protein
MLFSQNATAYESSGFLKDLFVNDAGLVLFRLSNDINQKPKCATNPDWHYQLDLKQAHSRAMFEMLQLSEQTKKPITVGYGPEAKCAKGISAIIVNYVLFKNLYQQSNHGKGNYINKK